MNMTIYGHIYGHVYEPYIGHIEVIHRPYISCTSAMYSLQYRPQMDHDKYEGNECNVSTGSLWPPPPIFWIAGMGHLWLVL